MGTVNTGDPGNSGSTYTYLWSGVAAGGYNLTAKATNAHATTTSSAASVTVLPPATVNLTAPANGATYAAPATITLSATAAQSGGSIAKVEFFSGSTVLGTVMTGSSGNSGSTYTFVLNNFDPGASAVVMNLAARSTDSNQATVTSTAVTVTVNPAAQTEILYVHADHLGTPRAITRPSDNAVVWKWDNTEPFGNNAANENPSGLGTFAYNLRFPGQYADSESNTNYNYFRDYDPSTGRYRQSDPIGLEAGLNTYSYVSSSPLMRIDPKGLQAILPGPIPIPIIVPEPKPMPPIILPKIFLDPPGDCGPTLYQSLKRDVDQKCKPNPGNCVPCQSCATMRERAAAHFECAAARKKMMDTCFRGGDPRHQIERVFRLHQGWTCVGLMPTCIGG